MDERDLRGILPEYLLGTLEPGTAAELEAALAASPALRLEAHALRRALFALPEELEPEPLAADAWQRLRAAVHADAGRPAAARVQGRHSDASPGPTPAGHASARPPTTAGHTTARPPTQRGGPPGGARRAPRSRGAPLGTPAGAPRRARRGPQPLALALAASLVVLLAVGAWGVRSSRQHAQLVREERIIAYWMRRPDLRIVALDGVGPGTAATADATPEVPPGIVCLLPDGRAMLLQPLASPRGTRYVLYGLTANGRVELGATRQRFLLFDHDRLTGVELALVGRGGATVAEASF